MKWFYFFSKLELDLDLNRAFFYWQWWMAFRISFCIVILEKLPQKVMQKLPIHFINRIGKVFPLICKKDFLWLLRMLKNHCIIMDFKWSFWIWRHFVGWDFFSNVFVLGFLFNFQNFIIILVQFERATSTFYMMFKTISQKCDWPEIIIMSKLICVAVDSQKLLTVDGNETEKGKSKQKMYTM